MFKLFLCNSSCVNEHIILDGKTYTIDSISKDSKGFIGFFDWLRIREETIVGIRISFFEDLNYTTILMKKSYVNSAFENKSVELLFTGHRFDSEFSGDQDFTSNYVYKSEEGDLLLTFGVDHLTEKELNSLLRYCKLIETNSDNS